MVSKKRILVAPLNWGLGHASRCVPIIQLLIKQGHHVAIASDGRALQLLKVEFPHLSFFELPAYSITYRSTNMFWNIGWQLPKIIQAIIREKYVVAQLIRQERFDIIISDNRFGAYAKGCRNIFLTHQLHLKTPSSLLTRLVNWGNHWFIRRFNECWIPDFTASEDSLTGSLSHPPLSHLPTYYLGAISRLEVVSQDAQWDILVLLSGPEPQRTFLEKKIITQLQQTNLKAIVVQGKTEKTESYQLCSKLQIVSFMSSQEINQTMAASKIVVCRSGYSTIMDLYQLRQSAILIPTPGQTEQEFLAKILEKKGIFHAQSQQHFELNSALKAAKKYTGFTTLRRNNLEQILAQLLE